MAQEKKIYSHVNDAGISYLEHTERQNNNASGVLSFIILHSVGNFFVQLLNFDRLLGERMHRKATE